MLKMNKKIDKLSRKRFFTGILNICKQKQGTSLVYMTKNCEHCILFITLRLTLKFHFIIRNHSLSIVNNKNSKIEFWPKSWPCLYQIVTFKCDHQHCTLIFFQWLYRLYNKVKRHKHSLNISIDISHNFERVRVIPCQYDISHNFERIHTFHVKKEHLF